MNNNKNHNIEERKIVIIDFQSEYKEIAKILDQEVNFNGKKVDIVNPLAIFPENIVD